MERWHIVGRATCPHLPGVAAVRTARDMAEFRGRYDGEFYLAALYYAQSLWLEGKPAQSLLQMYKAMMADLGGRADEPEDLEDGRKRLGWPLPYAAKVWVMRNAGGNEFLGNPVRHYQHLATRMSGERTELRTWRAWACFHLAERVSGTGEFPRDEKQLGRERVRVPEWAEVVVWLDELGLRGEGRLADRVCSDLTPPDR